MDWQRQLRSTKSIRHWRSAKHPCSTSIHVIKSKEPDVLIYNIQGRDTTSCSRGVRIRSEPWICGFDSRSGISSFVCSPSSSLSMCTEGRTGWVNGPCCWGITCLLSTKYLPEPFSGDVRNLGMKSQKYQREISLICFNQLQYYDQWLQVLRKVQKEIPSTSGTWETECNRLRVVCKVYRNLADGPKSLRNLDYTFTDSSDTLEWKNKAGEMVAKLKPFSEFMRGAGVSWTANFLQV